MALKFYRVNILNSAAFPELIEIDSRLLLSANKVAAMLGISVETLRRWIKLEKFPPSVIRASTGKTDYWLKSVVVQWLKTQHKKQTAVPKRALFKNMDSIDKEEAVQWSVRPIDEQALLRSLSRMNELLENDPKAFVQKYPSLKNWVKERVSNRKIGRS